MQTQPPRNNSSTLRNPSRRNFLAGSAVAAAALAGGALAQNSPAPRRKRIKLGISTYSYWHFRPPKVSIEEVIEKTAELGVEGLDILHRQMDIPEKEPFTVEHRAHCQRLKRLAFTNGVDLVCLSVHQNFVSPDKAVLQRNIEHTFKCIEIAYALGVPCLRINSGRWGTIASFDELMKARGEEPALPGHTEDEAFKWCIECIEKCLPKAAECGVILAVENHWGLSRTPEGQLRIVNAIKSPWLGALMDTGNFLENPYDKLKAIASRTVFVQAKTYPGGGEWYSLGLDYDRIARILADANYTGYVSLEMEGKEPANTAVPKSIAMLRKAFGS
ncbi:MAG: sugar phosphate isomerase/epimerase [Verrucomicrobia bacterium]|nr:sugar phosphate isomerase/epimerase [Verrucomicrobiota bacterium]